MSAPAHAIVIIDEKPNGSVLRRFALELVSEKITVRHLIERRVREEVLRFNAETEAVVFGGLVQPNETEIELNGYRLRKKRALDADTQCEQAIEAFRSNRFFMLVDNRQVESLDEEIVVGRDMKVSFVKLTPLVGG